MAAPLSSNPLTPAWMGLCGIIVVAAAMKEASGRVHPLALAAKRPSLQNTMLIGLLVKHAVEELGRSATATPHGQG